MVDLGLPADVSIKMSKQNPKIARKYIPCFILFLAVSNA